MMRFPPGLGAMKTTARGVFSGFRDYTLFIGAGDVQLLFTDHIHLALRNKLWPLL